MKRVRKVALLGLGLMGGSLGLACKRLSPSVHVSAYARREETRRLALAGGVVDAVYADPAEAVQDADLTVLCTPILDMPPLVEQVKRHLKPGSIVTDVGSTKLMLEREVGRILSDTGVQFCGSHPMAGSERTGISVARADLYDRAVVIVTPPEGMAEAVVEQVVSFWRETGARVLVMDAGAHDGIVAGTSHVPHLVAALLVRAADRTAENPVPFCGPGFWDATRIAAGSEHVWHDIVKSNAGPIQEVLSALRSDVDQLIGLLEAERFEEIRDWLAGARMRRESMFTASPNAPGREGV